MKRLIQVLVGLLLCLAHPPAYSEPSNDPPPDFGSHLIDLKKFEWAFYEYQRVFYLTPERRTEDLVEKMFQSGLLAGKYHDVLSLTANEHWFPEGNPYSCPQQFFQARAYYGLTNYEKAEHLFEEVSKCPSQKWADNGSYFSALANLHQEKWDRAGHWFARIPANSTLAGKAALGSDQASKGRHLKRKSTTAITPAPVPTPLPDVSTWTPITVPVGTPVVLELLETVSSKTSKTGDTISMKVAADVRVQGRLVVAAHTPVLGQVTKAGKAGSVGEAGELIISVQNITAIDGTGLPVRLTKSTEGEDKQTSSIVWTLLCCILFLLKKGEEVEITAGTNFTAYTMVPTQIKAP